ncbi:Sugar transporter STL1, partial [Fusarium oxysporum f. sp. albedinis]
MARHHGKDISRVGRRCNSIDFFSGIDNFYQKQLLCSTPWCLLL